MKKQSNFNKRILLLLLFFVLFIANSLFFPSSEERGAQGDQPGRAESRPSSESVGQQAPWRDEQDGPTLELSAPKPERGKPYFKREDVALYLRTYQSLPVNYLTKEAAKKENWTTASAPGRIIGGDVFANREGLLPKKKGRRYFEADLMSGYQEHRGPERLVYSNDGLIFYTPDHYDHFIRLLVTERDPS